MPTLPRASLLMVQIGAFFKNKCKLSLCFHFCLHHPCFQLHLSDLGCLDLDGFGYGRGLFVENLVGRPPPLVYTSAYTHPAHALALFLFARTGSGRFDTLRMHSLTMQGTGCSSWHHIPHTRHHVCIMHMQTYALSVARDPVRTAPIAWYYYAILNRDYICWENTCLAYR